MDKGEAHSKPGIGNPRQDSPVFPPASGRDFDLDRKLRLHSSYASGRTPSRRPPGSARFHGIIHTGPSPLISNLMPIKSAKVCAYHKFFLRGPRMPSGTRLSGPNSALYLLMPIESPKTIAAPQRNFAWGRSQRIRACQFWVAGPKTARLSWIAGRGRRLWRGDARCWLAGRPLLRQTFGAAS
jgi:hypothetical protein